jgi:hypothetical protein
VTPVPLKAAASELGVHVGTLRRWVARGAPVARSGRRGRGAAVLVHVEQIAAWRASSEGAAALPVDGLRSFAGLIPEFVANACWSAWLEVEGPHKRQAAGALAAAWYEISVALLDQLRSVDPALTDIPDPSALPLKIEQLVRHFRGHA